MNVIKIQFHFCIFMTNGAHFRKTRSLAKFACCVAFFCSTRDKFRVTFVYCKDSNNLYSLHEIPEKYGSLYYFYV